MRVIGALQAGIPEAAGGTVEILTRNGGASATWYEDYEGDVQNTTGAPIALDDYGSKVIYVNQAVRVRVKDSGGVVVQDWVDGDAAPGVEVRSNSFTGTDYDTGIAAVNNPTTLQALLDLVLTKFGTIDWSLLTHAPTGVTATPKGLASLGYKVFSVTDPLYGAKGNGTTDDTVAVNAAIVAANVAGGIVYFPPGVYRITAALSSLSNYVHVQGAGPSLSAISYDNPGGTVFGCNQSVASYQRIRGITVTFGQASSAIIANQGQNNWLLVEDCAFGSAILANGIGIQQTNTGCRTLVRDSEITLGTTPSTTTKWINGNTTDGEVYTENCRFNAPPAAWTPSATNAGGIVAFLHVHSRSKFNLTVLTGGSGACLGMPAAGEMHLIGNHFTSDGSGTFIPNVFLSAAADGCRVYDHGNRVECTDKIVFAMLTASFDNQALLLSRDTVVEYTSGNPPVPPGNAQNHASAVFEITGANAFAYNKGPVYQRQRITLHWVNTSGGGTGTLSLGANYIWEGSTTLTAGQKMSAEFIALKDPANSDALTFFQIGTRVKV